MSNKRKPRKTKEEKFKIAIEAIKGNKTLTQIANEYGVHTSLIVKYKKDLLENGPDVFSTKSSTESTVKKKEVDNLYKTIGSQTMEIEFLKKSLGMYPKWKG